MRRSLATAGAIVALALMLAAIVTGTATAETPEWRLEPVTPPALPSGEEAPVPIGLGKIGDISFWAPNRGVLITAGNPPTVPPGVWAYNGRRWHELSTVCGASDGRIAWAGPEDFWTVSDGRPGQVNSEQGGAPPLADNTLCHFVGGQVVASYGSLAFRGDSYQAMHAAGCLGASDCWFAGDPLPEGQVGAFHLHWNGSTLAEQPNPQGHAVEDMRLFNERLYESVRLSPGDLLSEEESVFAPSVLHLIRPIGEEQPFLSLTPGVPEYASGEFPQALDFLHLSGSEAALWGAANPVSEPPAGSTPAEVTVLRNLGGAWSQLIGPNADPEGGNPFTKLISAGEPTQEEREKAKQNEIVNAVGAEPEGEHAWLALGSPANSSLGALAPAMVARLSGDKTVSERQTLPSAQEVSAGVGPKGAASKLTCPAANDCWLATSQGWLFHLSSAAERYLPLDGDPVFAGLITFRPADQGLPSVVPDAPPVDDSGLPGELKASQAVLVETTTEPESRVTVPLVSHIRTRLVHGSTLQVSFHLAVKARVRLLAKRKRKIVAHTPQRIFASGNRKLDVRLDPRRWPTKLDLQGHALAPLPTTSTRGAGVDSVGTGFRTLPQPRSLLGKLP
jgi:hypothetical protein